MIDILPGVNSYISLAGAQDIAAEYLFAKDDDRFPVALVTATRFLDRLHWRGRKTSTSQELEWPRVIYGPSHAQTAADVIPPAIARGCVELAYHLLAQGTPTVPLVQMRQLGDSMAMYYPTVADDLPRQVRKLVAPYLNVESAHVAEMIG